MSIDAHLATLEKKHGELEAELRTVQANHPFIRDDCGYQTAQAPAEG
jgi:hypothetical protein